eukprot:Blabericola_migrator_1__11709@NODE_707_length_6783_cov_46_864800_g512_i0_p7_GENE_NODE_707_length_6783_cov_46_864800_g512_i0NODE_707_length_6783_cov_46_864800_g512_i0_p7_ORF_typecomplete_len116_score24_90T3SSipB/PF16535_5/0_011CCDC14/PF15254_6/0_022KASH_CCD/PF14662_6/0_048Tropomyosin_1/PF12718_7/0_061WEMBL/PF05701_11/0_067DUF3450/PF11932_8/0_13_NODE_707_length_6783_cov_46_864800_g512_i017532100
MIQDLLNEARSGKQVLKSVQDGNALLRREVDRLNKKLVQAKCQMEHMQDTRGEYIGVKKRRLSMSEELQDDPIFQKLAEEEPLPLFKNSPASALSDAINEHMPKPRKRCVMKRMF